MSARDPEITQGDTAAVSASPIDRAAEVIETAIDADIVRAVNHQPHAIAVALHAAGLLVDDDTARLVAWKAEAVAVLAGWEAVWEAAGRPGALGASKAESVRRLVAPAGRAAGTTSKFQIRNLLDLLDELRQHLHHAPGCSRPHGPQYRCRCGLAALCERWGWDDPDVTGAP